MDWSLCQRRLRRINGIQWNPLEGRGAGASPAGAALPRGRVHHTLARATGPRGRKHSANEGLHRPLFALGIREAE